MSILTEAHKVLQPLGPSHLRWKGAELQEVWFEPRYISRQRLDHYGNDGQGWDEEAWRDEYCKPLIADLKKRIGQRAGHLEFVVEEKGYVSITPKEKT